MLINFFFGGGHSLTLIKRDFNSGGAGGPRNDGMRLSRGEYIMFIDSDDAITNTALEELYTIAKKFDADFIHCEKYYKSPGETATTNKAFLKTHSYEPVNFVTEPTLITENIAERVRDFSSGKFFGAPWNQLFSRKMIMQNDIKFPDIKHGEDWVFDFFCLLYSKNIVRVPNIVYIWRNTPNSAIRSRLSVENTIRNWSGSIFRFIGILSEFMKKFDLFQTNPEYKYAIFDEAIRPNLMPLLPLYLQIPPAHFDKILCEELEKINDTTDLTAFLFNRMNFFNANIMKQQQIIQQQQAQIQQLQTQLREVQNIK